MITAIDIETIPNLNLVDCLPEVKAAANLKDPAKIEADIAAKKQEQIDKMALSPFYGRICAFSHWSEKETGWNVMGDISDAEEINILRDVFYQFTMESQNFPSIISWNGFSFDIPFIFKRAMLLKMELPASIPGMHYWTKKYSHVPHCDMMKELTQWEPGNTLSLDNASRVILGEAKDPCDFTKFIDMIKAEDTKEIALHCLRDSELTYRIYKVAERYLF
jgi:predicted PolB exonuclease-like 3'-5' exonuclease